MKTIRQGIFETNSSSTHSISIVTQELFDKWKKGEVLYDYNTEKLFEVDKSIIEQIKLDQYESDYFLTYDEYFNNFESELESYIKNYKTPNGEELVVFGKYGYDG